MAINDTTSRCPVTGYPVITLDGWANITVDKYTYSYSKIGDSIIVASNSGDVKYFNTDVHYQLLESFARKTGIIYPIIEIRDTGNMKGKPTSAQMVRQKQYFIENQEKFAGVAMCNVPFWLRAVVLAALSRYKTSIEFMVCKTVEEALKKSQMILEKMPLLPDSGLKKLSVDMLEFKKQWQFEDNTRQVFYRNGVIPGKVFYSSVHANYFSMNDFRRVSPFFEQVFLDGTFTHSKYIRIVDYSHMKKASITLRQAYAKLQIQLNKKYHCSPAVTYICGANLFVKTALKLFSGFVKQNFVFFDTIDQIFEDICSKSHKHTIDNPMVKVSQKDIEEINNVCGMLIWDEEEAQKGGAVHVSQNNALYQLYETISLVQEDLINLRQREIAQAAKLKKALKDAEAANQAKVDFLANMSHELLTPLNGVVGMLDVVSDTRLTREQAECIHAAKISADKLQVLVNDIFEFMKLGEDNPVLNNKHFHLGALIDTISRSVVKRVSDKKIAYNVSIDKNVPERLYGDPDCLLKILHHIIGNAIKFVEKGSVGVCISKLDETGDTVLLLFEIIDTGVGIPEEKQKDLFGMFTQVDTSTTRRHEGSGLGLSITNKLVDLLGGDIGFNSSPGSGSRFWVKIAYKKQSTGEQIEQKSGKRFSAGRNEKKQILVVDDNRMNQRVAGVMLKKMGYAVVFADNGRQAVEMYEPEKFDLILMDLQMPVMDGKEAVKNIRDIESGSDTHIPIVALTADTAQDSKKECLDIGMDDFISKPLKKDVMARTIERFL